MQLFLALGTKQELFSIVAQPVTSAHIPKIASEIDDDARVYFDTPENNGGPRNWPSYHAFLGFHIAKAAMTYQLDAVLLQELVKLVYEQAHQ